ncbi:MAG: hypothetical protein ACRDLL_11385, partial [Solirubrobacterales bacterium]
GYKGCGNGRARQSNSKAVCPMAVKRYVLMSLAASAALALALTFALKAQGEEAVTIIALNTGGMPTANTNKCEYTLRHEVCQVTVTNGPAQVKIVNSEITGFDAGARYNVLNETCTVGSELAPGATCNEEVILLLDKPHCPPNNWSNGYLIKVEEVGEPKSNATAVALLKV